MRLSVLARKIRRLNMKYFYKTNYIKYYHKLKLQPNTILIEPQQGRTINGSMFYMIKELCQNEEYSSYKVYVAIKKEAIESCMKILEYNHIRNVNVVMFEGKEYYKLLASAQYLVTDTSFPLYFIKKEGQEILNTWHGTPLKYLGNKIKNNYHSIGNVQKNFIIADYLLYPNEYTKDHLIEDYMLENISKAKVMLAGYPRNTAFFDQDSEAKIRKELQLEDKEIFVYMPTWRESLNQADASKNAAYVLYNLSEIEKKLTDNQILYVNLHPLERKNIDFSIFSKIKEFPEQYETYQFLNIANCLITDYSSVFFDFAITKKKIILFCYDEEEYLSKRGLYFDYKELPFTKANTVDKLIEAMNTQKDYDETEFIKKFCSYDAKDITKKICEKFILKKENDLLIQDIPNNGKENILMYVGNLAKNGITSSIRNLLYNIDTTDKNYYLTFSTNKIDKNKEQLLHFPKEVKYISTVGKTNMTILQKILFRLYRKDIIPLPMIKKVITKVYHPEIKRLYGNIKFDTVIQFGGYEYKKILLYSQFDCNKVIYVHSDMINEIKTRQNQHRKTLKYAYKVYDKVAIVTAGLKDSVVQISGKEDNIFVADNIINYKSIKEKAAKNVIKFNENTESTVSLEELNEILDGENKKFITIGRFSPEKGHARLIRAFNKLYQENKAINLIIIGGTGKQYEKTLELIQTLEARKNIIIIKDVANPYTILKKCDYFVLSSYYEGFGLVIAEADILQKPVISTDIAGPKALMLENGGTLVENTQEGLYKGMKKLLAGEVQVMDVDYEKYNQNAIKEFYELLKK